MDYNGTVDSANPAVSVHLLDKARIQNNLRVLSAWPLLKNEKKWWQSREDKIQYLLSCRNDQFRISAHSWNIEQSPETDITVRIIAEAEIPSPSSGQAHRCAPAVAKAMAGRLDDKCNHGKKLPRLAGTNSMRRNFPP
jgi:hypothetical protein